jgi:hypothetical protein
MFSRALQQEIAYRMAADDETTLSEWPAKLNDPHVVMRNGFQGVFQSNSDLMKRRTVRSFFPCGPFRPRAQLTWNPGVCFKQVLMNRDLDRLIDDIGNFAAPGPVQLLYQYRYIEVHRVGKRVEVVVDNGVPRTGILNENDPWQGPIREHIFQNRERRVSKEPEEEEAGHIPLPLIADFAIPKLLEAQPGFQLTEMEDDAWYDELRSKIGQLNGTVQRCETGGFCRLYQATVPMEDRVRALQIIAEARVEVQHSIPKYASSVPGVHVGWY